MLRCSCALLALAAAAAPAQAPRWKVQYFYDQEKTSFTINDFQFLSAKRGLAVGFVLTGKHEDPMSLLTSDGGEHWDQVPLKETPISLFFLDEGLGWMVTTKGLWKTNEAGRSWTKLPKLPDGILRVCFLNDKDGWGVGLKKSVITTHDGGQHWEPLAAAATLPGEPRYSAFVWVAFANSQIGLITGGNIPPRLFVPSSPEWLDPQSTLRMRDVPHLSYAVATNDGGKTWQPKAASMFGQTARFRLLPNGSGIGLIEFSELFQAPCEVYKIDWHSGKSTRIYQNPSISITDVWLDADGTAYLSGIAEPGRVRDIIPGKVKVFISHDMQTWTDMAVDYRAEAIRTIMSVPDPQHRWLATDNGMILKLTDGK